MSASPVVREEFCGSEFELERSEWASGTGAGEVAQWWMWMVERALVPVWAAGRGEGG